MAASNQSLIKFMAGGILLAGGLALIGGKHLPFKKAAYGLGSIILLEKMTKLSPLFSIIGFFGGKKLLSKLKQALPGYGINPLLTQQAVPQRQTQQIDNTVPFAAAVKIR